jgi:hypothetical protein
MLVGSRQKMLPRRKTVMCCFVHIGLIIGADQTVAIYLNRKTD